MKYLTRKLTQSEEDQLAAEFDGPIKSRPSKRSTDEEDVQKNFARKRQEANAEQRFISTFQAAHVLLNAKKHAPIMKQNTHLQNLNKRLQALGKHGGARKSQTRSCKSKRIHRRTKSRIMKTRRSKSSTYF